MDRSAEGEMMRNVTFVSLNHSLKCIVCRKCVFEPQQLSCGHRACRQCVVDTASKSNGSCCPSGDEDCRQSEITLEKVNPDYAAERELKRSKVFCPNRPAGCTNQTEYFKLQEHVGICEHRGQSAVDGVPEAAAAVAAENNCSRREQGRGLNMQRIQQENASERVLNNEEATVYEYHAALQIRTNHQLKIVLVKRLLQSVFRNGRWERVKCLFILFDYDGVSAEQLISDGEAEPAGGGARVMAEIHRSMDVQRTLPPFVSTTMTGDCTMIGEKLVENPRCVLDEDKTGRNAIYYALVSNKNLVIDLLFRHIGTVLRPQLNNEELRDVGRTCLASLPFANSFTVDKIFHFVRMTVVRDDKGLRRLINEPHETYDQVQTGAISWRQGPNGERRGSYLVLLVAGSGNYYALEQLLRHGADVNVVDQWTGQTVYALALDLTTAQQREKLHKILQQLA